MDFTEDEVIGPRDKKVSASHPPMARSASIPPAGLKQKTITVGAEGQT